MLVASLLFALASAMPAPAAAAASSPPDGTYVYTASVAGTPAGQSTVTVKHGDKGIDVTETADATLNGRSLHSEVKLTLADDLIPTVYLAKYHTGPLDISASVLVSGTSATETSPQGSLSFALAPGTKSLFVLDGALMSGPLFLPALMQSDHDAALTGIVPLVGRALPISVDANANPAHPAGVPADDVSLNISGQPSFTLWYDPHTFVVDELDAPSQGYTATRKR